MNLLFFFFWKTKLAGDFFDWKREREKERKREKGRGRKIERMREKIGLEHICDRNLKKERVRDKKWENSIWVEKKKVKGEKKIEKNKIIVLQINKKWMNERESRTIHK